MVERGVKSEGGEERRKRGGEKKKKIAKKKDRECRDRDKDREGQKEKEEEKQKEESTTPKFRVWSPTTLLGSALSGLTTVDRTGNGAFH